MSIQEILEKCKLFLSGDVAVALIVVLVGLSSFGLGRLSVGEGKEPFAISYPASDDRPAIVLKGAAAPTAPKAAAAVNTAAAAGNGPEVIASKNGSKYYLPTCSGASRISEANIVKFPSPQAAQASGYSAAANCPGI